MALVRAMLVMAFATAASAPPGEPTAPTSQPATMPAASGAAATYQPLSLWQRDRLTGDWGGVRTALEDAGVRTDLYYNHLLGYNIRGGANVNRAWRQSGSADLLVHLDYDKMDLVPGGQMLLHAKGHFSRNLNAVVGALSDPFDDADGDKSIYIDQLWYQQDLAGRALQLRVGYLDQQTILDRNAYANNEDVQFLSTYLDNNNAAVPLPIGLGASLFINPTDWLSFVIGAADGDARLYRDGFDTTFHGGADFFGFFETDVKLDLPGPRGKLPGTYRIGVLYDPRPKQVFEFRDADDTAPLPVERDDVGLYLSFDQMVFRERPDDLQGLGLFLRYGYRHGNVNRVSNFWSAGWQYEGLLPKRDRDVLGVGFYSAHASRRYNDWIDPDFQRETGLEVYYKIQVTPWLTVTPDFQYIAGPGGSRRADNDMIAGLRMRVSF